MGMLRVPMGLPRWLVVKNPSPSAGDERDMGSISGSGRSPGGGHGNPPSITWRIPWTEEPRGLQSTGLQRVGYNWSDLAHIRVPIIKTCCEQGMKQHIWKQTGGQHVQEKIINITNHWGNANRNHNETTSHLLEWLLSQRQEIRSVGEDVEKREPSCTVGGNVNWYRNWYSHCIKQYGGCSKT